jgi:phosphoenolpyruvate carboxykinase (ATP)
MKLAHTRAMISAALDGHLDEVPTEVHPVFGLEVPTRCNGVPDNVWDVRGTWEDPSAYDEAASDLASRFAKNFEKFEEHATEEMKLGAPLVSVSEDA